MRRRTFRELGIKPAAYAYGYNDGYDGLEYRNSWETRFVTDERLNEPARQYLQGFNDGRADADADGKDDSKR